MAFPLNFNAPIVKHMDSLNQSIQYITGQLFRISQLGIVFILSVADGRVAQSIYLSAKPLNFPLFLSADILVFSFGNEAVRHRTKASFFADHCFSIRCSKAVICSCIVETSSTSVFCFAVICARSSDSTQAFKSSSAIRTDLHSSCCCPLDIAHL